MVVWQGITEGGTAVPVQVTEEGRVVAEGQEGKEGPPGQPGPPGPPGPQGEYGPGDDVDLGNITAAGTVTAAGTIYSGDVDFGATSKEGSLMGAGSVFIQKKTGNNSSAIGVFYGIDTTPTFNLKADGSISASAYQYLNNSNSGSKNVIAIYNGTDGTETFPTFQVDSDGTTRIGQYLTSNPKIELKSADGSITAAGDKCGFTAAGELFLTSRGTRYKLVVAGGLVNAEPYTRAMELKEKAEAARSPRGDSVRND